MLNRLRTIISARRLGYVYGSPLEVTAALGVCTYSLKKTYIDYSDVER